MFFKRVSKFTGNFLNVLKTLSEKHELYQSYLRSGARQKNDLVPFRECHFHVNWYSQEIREAVVRVDAVPPLVECGRMQYKGTIYRQECAVVLPERSLLWDEKFGIIKRIFYDANQSVFFS